MISDVLLIKSKNLDISLKIFTIETLDF